MEAIKPGSTHDQWAAPFPQDEVRKKAMNAVGDPSPSRSHAHSFSVPSKFDDTDHPTPAANVSTKAGRSMTLPASADTLNIETHEESTVEITVRQPTPPPRSEISLRNEPFDPYVSASEVLSPLKDRDSIRRNSKVSCDHPSIESDDYEDETNKESIYLTLLPQEEPSVSAPQSPVHHHQYSTIVDTKSATEIVAELEKQFTPLEIDLLVKMLETVSAKAKATAKSKERRKSADYSVVKERREAGKVGKPYTDVEEDPESSGLYSRLADLVLNLDELEPAGVLAEQNILYTPESDEKSDTASIETGQESNTVPSSISSSESAISASVYSRRVPSRTNPQHGSLKEGNLSRKNAVRQRKGVHAKPKETVTHLSKFNFCVGFVLVLVDNYVVMLQLGRLLRRASSEDYLEESDDTASWSRAVGMCLSIRGVT